MIQEEEHSRLVCLGNAIVDVTMTVPALPPPGGDVVATRSGVTVGGAFNVMAAAARNGLHVAYAGAHGTGPFADRVRAALGNEGIATLLPASEGQDTGFDVAVTDASGERTFLTTIGAEARLTAGSLDPVQAADDDMVYLSGYTLLREPNRGTILRWLETVPRSVCVLVDPGPFAAQIDQATLTLLEAHTTWWTCNEREAVALTGATDATRAAAALATRTSPSQRATAHGALVRLGKRGCVLCVAGSDPASVPAFTVKAVDTNGAGDAHTGVFIASLAAGLPPAIAARRANAAAALATTRYGPATAPDAATLEEFLHEAADQSR